MRSCRRVILMLARRGCRRPLVAVALIVVLATVAVAPMASSPPPPLSSRFDTHPTTATVDDRTSSPAPAPAPERSPLLPLAGSPLRVLEIGDSLGIDLGDQLQAQLDPSGLAAVTVAAKGDTGLSNPSYYDWPAHLLALLASGHPQIVVVFLGANDDQGLSVAGGAAAPGTSAWVTGYSQRVDDVIDEATMAGARVVWVGMPPMADSDLNQAMQREDAIYQGRVDRVSDALYVSSIPVLGGPSGAYQGTTLDGSGQPIIVRTPDGVLLSPAGAGLLARVVIDSLDQRWHLALGRPTVARTTVVRIHEETNP